MAESVINLHPNAESAVESAPEAAEPVRCAARAMDWAIGIVPVPLFIVILA